MKRKAIFVFFLASSCAYADLYFESQPWTRSFLETTCSFSLTHIAPRLRKKGSTRDASSRLDGEAYLSTAPFPEWQVDMVLAESTTDTGKLAIGCERMILSDLQKNSCALSVFLHISKAQQKRAKNPLFFEMTTDGGECGIAIGKHMYVRKNSYTQLFASVLGGMGRKAFWSQYEVGFLHSLYDKHSLRCSFSHVRTLGNQERFCGYGTIRSHIPCVSFLYSYQMQDCTLFFRYSKRWATKSSLCSADAYTIGISFPLSF